MPRLTSDLVRIAVVGPSLERLREDERDLDVEDALGKAGLRALGVARVIPADEDAAPPPQTADARHRPMQVLSLSQDPGTGVATFARTSPVPLVAHVERNDRGTWLSVVSVFPDGTLLRTVRRPEGIPEGLQGGAGEVLSASDAPLAAWFLRLTVDKFAFTFRDQPWAGLRQQVLPNEASARQVLRAHEELAMSLGEPVVVDDLELDAAVQRRFIHALAASLAWDEVLGTRVGWGAIALRWALAGVLLWPGVPGLGAFAALLFLVRRASAAVWQLLMGDVEISALGWWGLLAAAAWTWGVAGAVGVAVAVQVVVDVAEMAAVLAADGVGAAALERWRTPLPKVAASELVASYPP